MTESEFLAAFEDGSLQEDFTHRSHIRMAWLILRAEGRNRGTERILAGLRTFVAAKGAAAKFHFTLTLVWIRLVDAAIKAGPPTEGFDTFLAAHPELGDSGLPYRYYSRERLMDDAAKQDWVEPDLAALP